MDKGLVIPHAYCLCQGLSLGDSWILEDDWQRAGGGKFVVRRQRSCCRDIEEIFGELKEKHISSYFH